MGSLSPSRTTIKPLTLHGNPSTINSQRCTLILFELNLPFIIRPVDFKQKAQKSPEYLALQPFGKVPVLEDPNTTSENDDGKSFFVYESRAICRYLALKYGGLGAEGEDGEEKRRLMPDPKDGIEEYALFEQACSMETCYFDPPISQICYEKIFKIKNPLLSVDDALVSKLSTSLDHVLSVYEVILSKQPYLAGNLLTLADLFHIPYAHMFVNLGPEFEKIWSKYPAVWKWFEELRERESWVRAVVLRP